MREEWRSTDVCLLQGDNRELPFLHDGRDLVEFRAVSVQPDSFHIPCGYPGDVHWTSCSLVSEVSWPLALHHKARRSMKKWMVMFRIMGKKMWKNM